MRKIPQTTANKVIVENIKCYFEKTVTKFGMGAKVDVPKEYLGKKVIVIIK